MYKDLLFAQENYKQGQKIICLATGKEKTVGKSIIVHEFYSNFIISEKPYCVLYDREENKWAEKV